MSWVQQTLSEFGRQLGLADLGFGAHGVAQLELQSGGFLAVEPVRRGQVEEVLVYFGRPLGFDAAVLVRRALLKAHAGHLGPLAVQLATKGTGPDTVLIMLVRLPERDFTLQTLGHAFDYLNRWFETVQA